MRLQTSGAFMVSSWVAALDPSQNFCPHEILENNIRARRSVNIGSRRKQSFFSFVISSHLIVMVPIFP